MKRIVSLIPSSTEIVCALGCGEQLVGCSHECDFPHFVKSLPTLTESKFDSEGTSYEIDQRVKAIVQDALSVYRVDVEQLERLQPDVILTQNQCEVCAVSLKDLEEAIKLFTGKSSPTIVSLEPNGLEDIWSDIRRVARALDAEEQANKLLENIQDRIEKIADKILQVTVQPTVVCIEWIEPLMVAGNWVPTLVKLAGGIDLLGKENEHAPWATWEELQEANPDIIVTMPCGYDIEKTRSEMLPLTSSPQWADLGAVKSGRVYFTDGNQYFNRSGPRLVESLEILTEIFHPETFQFGHKGTGWIQDSIS